MSYALAQYQLLAKDGWRFTSSTENGRRPQGFMVSPDGFRFIPVPHSEKKAAKKASCEANQIEMVTDNADNFQYAKDSS